VTDYEQLMSNQISYYRQRAAEYDVDWPEEQLAASTAEIRNALRQFIPSGKVLEIACGTGKWTGELLRYAEELLALDASPEMLAINRQKLGDDSRVRYVQADVFSWQPDDWYDVVFFSHWLSHVPGPLFEQFWARVASCLTANGRAFFVDELPDEMWKEEYVDDARAVVRRRVQDGTEHEVVKVFWEPDKLKQALHDLGWNISVTRAGPLYWGTGKRFL
jgi:SAM-dependent methyltransferase